MFKVSLFISSARGGGAQKTIVNLAKGFVEQGLNVDLLLAKVEGPYLTEVPLSVQIINLNARRVLHALPVLIRYLCQAKPYAMLSALNYVNIIAIWAKLLSRVKIRLIVSEHNTLSQSTKSATSLKIKLMPLLIKCFYPRADAVVAVSRGVAEDLVAMTGISADKVKVIYNPVITPDLFAKAKEPLDHPWFQPGEPPVILSVGRLTKQKDFPTLIRAFAIVRKELPVRLMILGEGEDRQELELLVRELKLERDVALPGFDPNPYKYMKRSAVFVLSSRWEGLPTALIEAMACGCPIVATDCPSGPAEILEEGKWGRLVPVGKPEILAQAILDVLYNPPEPPPEMTLKRFSLEEVVTLYLQVLGII